MWWFEVDSHIRRKLARWEHRRAREMGLFEPGYLVRVYGAQAADILRNAEKPLLCAELSKGARMGLREEADRYLRTRPCAFPQFENRPKGMVRSCVYYRLEDVPRRPAYAMGECVSTRTGNGRVDRSQVAHCGPNGGYMWTYDLWMYDERVPRMREHVWEEDVRPLAREDC